MVNKCIIKDVNHVLDIISYLVMTFMYLILYDVTLDYLNAYATYPSTN